MTQAQKERYNDLLWNLYERKGRKGLHQLCIVLDLMNEVEEKLMPIKLTWDEHKNKTNEKN